MSKCIKCGRGLTSGEIPEFNYGMCDKCYKDYQCKQYPFKKGMFDMQDEIQQLKQQLEEKGKEINQLKQEKKNAGEEKARAYLDTLTKPKIIELCLQYINDKNIAEQQLEALMLEISKQEVEQHDLPDYCTRTGTDCTYLGKIEELKQKLEESFTEEDVEGLIEDRNKTIKFLQKQLEEKDKEIEDLKKWQDWYSIWHENFKKQIEDLTTELETYRPTKLHGNGQCECYKCKQEGKQPIHWTNWCNEYKGHIYCNDCLKEILKEEQSSQTQLAIKELEKVKVNLKDRISMMKNEEHSYLQKVVAWRDICDQINKQIKELKGENK